MTPGQGLGLFSAAGDPMLGLTLPIGDSGARRGVMASSEDRVRLCRCAEMGPSLGMGASVKRQQKQCGHGFWMCLLNADGCDTSLDMLAVEQRLNMTHMTSTLGQVSQ